MQNTTRPDPKKLWDIRPLLRKVIVEAPGIEWLWKETGFNGSQFVSREKRQKNKAFGERRRE
jgi:hypothetical protein